MIMSVEKAISILNYVAGCNDEPVPIGKISKNLKIPMATCSRLVETLCSCQYLERISRNEGCIIGPAAFCLTTSHMYRMDLLRVAVPFMKKLCKRLKENVVISTYTNGEMYMPFTIYYKEDRMTPKAAARGDLFSYATGLVILAYLDHRERDDLILKNGRKYPDLQCKMKTQADLHKELLRIRETGVNIAYQINDRTSAIACPIFAHDKNVAAIGVNMPNERFYGDHLNESISYTKQIAEEISRKLSAED